MAWADNVRGANRAKRRRKKGIGRFTGRITHDRPPLLPRIVDYTMKNSKSGTESRCRARPATIRTPNPGKRLYDLEADRNKNPRPERAQPDNGISVDRARWRRRSLCCLARFAV